MYESGLTWGLFLTELGGEFTELHGEVFSKGLYASIKPAQCFGILQ